MTGTVTKFIASDWIKIQNSVRFETQLRLLLQHISIFTSLGGVMWFDALHFVTTRWSQFFFNGHLIINIATKSITIFPESKLLYSPQSVSESFKNVSSLSHQAVLALRPHLRQSFPWGSVQSDFFFFLSQEKMCFYVILAKSCVDFV